jgi:PPOX class probable F420-dependent enzyme
VVTLPPEQRKLFEEPNLAAVSTLGADGGSHVTMAWVDAEDDELVFNSAEHRGWPKNLRNDPRVAVCVFDRNNWVRNVAVTGRVTSMSTEGAWDHIQRLARKYGQSEYKGATDRVIIRVAVESSFGYSL